MTAKIQVILPSFNRPNTVQQTIRSILDQTFSDFRLYIMDNSSPSLWPVMQKIYLRYISEDSRIVVDHTHVENSERRNHVWIAIVTNKALYKLSQQEPYVVLSCDDDIMSFNKLYLLSDYLDRNPHDQYVHGIMQLIDDNGRAVQSFGGGDMRSGSCAVDWLQPMWRRSLLEKIGPIREDLNSPLTSPDSDMFIEACKHTRFLRGLPYVLDKQFVRNKKGWFNKERIARSINGLSMD